MQIAKKNMRLLFMVSISIQLGCVESRDTLRIITEDRTEVEQHYRNNAENYKWVNDNDRRISCEDVYLAHNPRQLNDSTPLDSIIEDIDCQFTDVRKKHIKYIENGTTPQGEASVLFCDCTCKVPKLRFWKTINASLTKRFYIMKTNNAEGYFKLVKIREIDDKRKDQFRPSVLYVYNEKY